MVIRYDQTARPFIGLCYMSQTKILRNTNRDCLFEAEKLTIYTSMLHVSLIEERPCVELEILSCTIRCTFRQNVKLYGGRRGSRVFK
jgi:hypothetical protein